MVLGRETAMSDLSRLAIMVVTWVTVQPWASEAVPQANPQADGASPAWHLACAHRHAPALGLEYLTYEIE